MGLRCTDCKPRVAAAVGPPRVHTEAIRCRGSSSSRPRVVYVPPRALVLNRSTLGRLACVRRTRSPHGHSISKPRLSSAREDQTSLANIQAPAASANALVHLTGDQARSIVTRKLSSWCSISSIVVSKRPMRTMPSSSRTPMKLVRREEAHGTHLDHRFRRRARSGSRTNAAQRRARGHRPRPQPGATGRHPRPHRPRRVSRRGGPGRPEPDTGCGRPGQPARPGRRGDSQGRHLQAAHQILPVNVVAPYLLTALIHRPQRLVYLSSGMHHGGRADLAGVNWSRTTMLTA